MQELTTCDNNRTPVKFPGFEPQQAIAQFNKVLELDPENQFISLFLGITYIQKGLFEEGIELLEYIWQSKKYAEHPFTLMLLCYAYAQAGNKEKANNILDIALKIRRKSYFSPYALAMMYSCLNEVDKAFEWLDIAYEKHDIIMYPIKTIPEFSVLHNDPRWFSLIRRMGLEG
jgi:adenylate cyclase